MNTAACLLLLAIAAPAADANELVLSAPQLYAAAIKRDVRLTNDGTAIELDEGELVEDDGPAAGYSYLPNEEKLSEQVWIKKELVLANPAARSATLLVGPGGALRCRVNGREIELKSPGKAGNYWQAYAIDPKLLKAGTNEIELGGGGRIWIARAEDFAAGSVDRPKHPRRSLRSTDGGKSWSRDQLGPNGDIAGEYYVRLFLDRHRPGGSLTLPVMDCGNLAEQTIAPALAKPIPIHVQLAAASEGVHLHMRSGRNFVVAAPGWSDWQEIPLDTKQRDLRGRFFQLEIRLSTTDPLRSPQVTGLRIDAALPADAKRPSLKSVAVESARIVRSSIPFTYESFKHPKLKQLRERYKLDAIAAGAKTELELAERLAKWSSGLWQQGHLRDIYPAWDAFEILKPHTDGKPIGGFCQQYNLAFLQACESFGIPGRAISIGPADHPPTMRGSGHEVVELWSNQFRKWIFVDGNFAWYAVEPKSGVPYSLLELRELQRKTLLGESPPIKIIHLNNDGKRWEGLTSFPLFGELRLIPRSNFLSEKSPLPLNQGMRGWFWTGHYAWTDRECPASLLYGHRVADRDNWEWTLNQCQVYLESTARPDTLRVQLDTVTPGFESFQSNVDGSSRAAVTSGFLWKLHAGKNELMVRSRNEAGHEGIPSRVVIDK